MITIFITILALSMGVQGDNLYPKCVGVELDQRLTNSQGEVLLTRIPGTGTKLQGDCIAFEITSVQQGTCDIPHQTDLPIRIFIRATGVSDPTYVAEFDVDDVLGGSINAMTFSTSRPSSFAVYARNQHPSADCMMRVRAIVEAAFVPEGTEGGAYAAPSVVNVRPPTVFARHVNATYVVLRTEGGSANADGVVLRPQGRDCALKGEGGIPMEKVTDPAVVQPLVAEYTNPTAHSVWKTHFEEGGTFVMCFERDGHPAEAIALMSVFGGNPRYFDVVKGGGARGEIYLFTEIVVRFYGIDLDTRPQGDQAKLVQDTDSCNDGEPAGGVPLARDLGPADDWGPRTTHTDWTLTITIGGAFKVCYKRASGPWTEVPLIYDIPASAIIRESTTAAPLIVPTDPINHQPCVVAPTRTEPAPPGALLRISLRGDVPKFWTSLFAQLICVPTSDVIVYRTTVTGGRATLLLDIKCGGEECSSDERRYYVKYTFLHTPEKFNELNLLLVEEIASNGLNIENAPQSASTHKGSHGAAILTSLTIIAVVAIVVYGVIVARRQEHRFIQFGIDDDDDAPQLSNEEGPVVRGIVPGTSSV